MSKKLQPCLFRDVIILRPVNITRFVLHPFDSMEQFRGGRAGRRIGVGLVDDAPPPEVVSHTADEHSIGEDLTQGRRIFIKRYR